jgi:hypothetical protein
MNNPTGNTASNAFDKPGRADAVLSLGMSRLMLPLVQRIVKDILAARRDLAGLRPQLAELNRHRQELSWPDRWRRYHLQEELAFDELYLQQAIGELENLGVALIDAATGQVGFPTLVNGRRAFFSWLEGEDGVCYWHFAGDSHRRRVPPSWHEDSPSDQASAN